MAGVTNLNIKIDRDLKAEADKLFNDMGMNLTTAVNVFVRQAVLERAIPFKIYRSALNAGAAASVEQRRAAMQEIRDLLADAGGDVDLDRMRAERRALRYERAD
ncbi:MAG: type II toxin-antitoxin system RelB/DinJ family antitoxin [Synergistaceae bacterium]|nr:type II toxin-antitoxin system RelB/DinJ family antitoxin [Synergistaceae bacterium]